MARRGEQGRRFKIDWDQAFAYYASLGPTRTYAEVCRRFGVTRRTVEVHAQREKWQERAAAIEAEARQQAEASIVRDRAARVADTLRIIDASRIKFASHLKESSFRLTGSDFVGLIKLEQLIEGEPTDRVDFHEVQSMLGQVVTVALRHIPKSKRQAFVEEIRGLGDRREADAA